MSSFLLGAAQQAQLEELLSGSLPERVRRKGETILLYHQGLSAGMVARLVHINRQRARRWQRRFTKNGMALFAAPTPPTNPAQAGTDATGESLMTDQPADPYPIEIEEPAAPADETLQEFAARLVEQKKTGILPEDTLAEAGRKVFGYHFAHMLSNEAGTRAGLDIEFLHDMRVATRRMRAALDVFGTAFKPKTVKNLRKGLRQTGRMLGNVRDLDVFLEKAGHYLETLPESERHGLDPLLSHWQDQQQAARQDMIKYLDSRSYAGFKARFFEFVTTPGAGTRPLETDPPEPGLVNQIAPVLLYQRLAETRAFGPLLPTASIEQFHTLRIECKKLRYTLEFFREVLGPEAKTLIEAIKTLQDHLGDLNDAQVATGILRDFLAAWDGLQADMPVSERPQPEAVVAYLSYRYAERQQLMQSFNTAWEQFSQPDLRRSLAQAVSVL